MANSFITYKDKNTGFWVDDYLMETVLYYILEVARNEKYHAYSFLHPLIVRFDFLAKGSNCSFMDLELDDFLSYSGENLSITVEGENVSNPYEKLFLNILEETKLKLENKGKFISPTELLQIEQRKPEELRINWNGSSLLVERLLHLLDVLSQLIKREITSAQGS